MLPSGKRILMIGYGAVARSVLPILTERLAVPSSAITVIDKDDLGQLLQPRIRQGLTFRQETITPASLSSILPRHVKAGDLIVDLSLNVDCLNILEWVKKNKVLYVNASVENWPGTTVNSYHAYYLRLRDMASRWKNSSTAVIDHGANPGLVSHFARKGLADIARLAIDENRFPSAKRHEVETLLAEGRFAALAALLGVRVIHCSERDTQQSVVPKADNMFVGTWSVEGMAEECLLPVEIAWGTHEDRLAGDNVPGAVLNNGIMKFPQTGMNTWARSWVPGGEFRGMIITHGEAFGISESLTISDGKNIVYRPTVHYVHLPSNETIRSLQEFRSRDGNLQDRRHIMSDDIQNGEDILGVLLMGHCYGAWWTGSILSINEARRLVPTSHQNATTIQVAAGVVSAIEWMLENPGRGLCFPEDLPQDYLLARSVPYLGRFVSEPCDWTPAGNRSTGSAPNPPDGGRPWQFNNFLVDA